MGLYVTIYISLFSDVMSTADIIRSYVRLDCELCKGRGVEQDPFQFVLKWTEVYASLTSWWPVLEKQFEYGPFWVWYKNIYHSNRAFPNTFWHGEVRTNLLSRSSYESLLTPYISIIDQLQMEWNNIHYLEMIWWWLILKETVRKSLHLYGVWMK
jgi:hypothetical protein